MTTKRGQIIVTTVLIIAILLLSIIVSLYETRLVYLRTRSIVVREVVGSITADFERALAHVLALATRAYFNYTRYEKMLSKYKEEGLTLENKHNFTIAREIGFKYLELWKTFVMESYAGYGVEVDYEATEKDLRIYLNRPRKIEEGQLMKGFWYYPFSASIINAKLKLNLTNVGFYGWVSEITIGLYLKIHDFNVSETENQTELLIGVLYDKGEPYPYLLTKGMIEVYVPKREKWKKVNITDVTYVGNGNYSVKIDSYVEPLYDPVSGKEIVPVLVVIGDDRGILVEACYYDHITFKIRRSVPDSISLSGDSVYCEKNNAWWILTGQQGYVFLDDYIKIKTKWASVITVRHADGTTETITIPKKRYVTFYFDHDSRLYDDGEIILDSNHIEIYNIHMDRINIQGGQTLDNVTVVEANIGIRYKLSKIRVEFRGNWLDMNSPCLSPDSNEGNWIVELSDLYPIVNLEISPDGTRLDVYARGDGIVKESSASAVSRPYHTTHEVYTLELAWDLNIYWLGMPLRKDPALQLPPIPFMPIKQLRVNVSIDGTENTLEKRPIQYEDWLNITWHGQNLLFPKGLSDPQEDYGPTTRLVFQVKFPNLDVDEQYVVIWWEDDLDAEPEAYPTQIEYLTGSNYKDVKHPLYDIEFVDLEHLQSRNYANYEGVAAFVMRDPNTDEAFGPYNLQGFDNYGNWKARFRPYGTWFVNYEYMRYSWIKAPIRIFAILNTTLVGDVYDGTLNSWDNYYDTLCIVQIVNGTRYIPVITFIYWKNSHSGSGYWLNIMMGRGYPEHFLYLHNDSSITYFDIGDLANAGTIEKPNPGYMITHWSADMGRALVISNEAIRLLKNIGGSDSRMASTYGGWTPYQGSIEYEFWSYSKDESTNAGYLLKYWCVIFDYLPLGGESGWLNLNEEDGWKNAIIYAPMFVEDYTPMVVSP